MMSHVQIQSLQHRFVAIYPSLFCKDGHEAEMARLLVGDGAAVDEKAYQKISKHYVNRIACLHYC
jgi:hypothetical protein